MVDVKQILSQMTTEEKIGQLMQHNANMFIDHPLRLQEITAINWDFRRRL